MSAHRCFTLAGVVYRHADRSAGWLTKLIQPVRLRTHTSTISDSLPHIVDDLRANGIVSQSRL